jgi:uncharacterized protein (TIGR02118 family)
MIVFSVLYPASEGARFDQAYYDATHIPLVKDAFGSTGLTDVKVFHGLSAGDGGPAPYVAMAHLTFRDAQALQASMGGPRAAAVLADVAVFTDIQPITQVSALG